MKIALAHNLYPPYAKGGAEKVVEKMAADFAASGNEVVIITSRPKKTREVKEAEEKTADANSKIKVYRLSSSYFNLGERNKFCRLFWHAGDFINPKRKAALEKIIDTEKPDLFITHNLIGIGFFLADILKNKKIKHEHFLHDIQLLHPSGLMFAGRENILNSRAAKIYQKITGKKFQMTAKVISPSKWLLNEHRKRNFFAKSETEIRPLRKLPAPHPNTQLDQSKKGRFLFVGQIEKHKGILFLIAAFKAIPQTNISLTIVGTGQDEEEAKKLAAKDQRIVFLGHLKSEEVKNEMEKAGALIVPSLCYENSPTVIYEAGEFSLPVIASNIGGIPEIMPNHNGLFKAGEIEDLIQKIKASS